MQHRGYKLTFIKIIAAMVSSVIFSLYVSWRAYTPVAERIADVYYYSFSSIFAFNFVPNFFIFTILGVMLSSVIERIVFTKFNMKGIKGILILTSAYILLGIISGVLIGVFLFGVHSIINVYMLSFLTLTILGALLFLFVQTIFVYGIYKFAR